MKSKVQAGVSTEEIDDFARELILIHKAYPSPLNFQGFPKSICTSGSLEYQIYSVKSSYSQLTTLLLTEYPTVDLS